MTIPASNRATATSTQAKEQGALRWFKIMAGVECVAVFPSVTRSIRFYGVRTNNRFIGLAIGGDEIHVNASALTRALRAREGR